MHVAVFERKTFGSGIGTVFDKIKHAYEFVANSSRTVLSRLRLRRTAPSIPVVTSHILPASDILSTSSILAHNDLPLGSILGPSPIHADPPTTIMANKCPIFEEPSNEIEMNPAKTNESRPSRKALIISCSYGEVTSTGTNANIPDQGLSDHCIPRGVPTSRGLPVSDQDEVEGSQDGPIGPPTLRGPKGGVLMQAHKDGKNFKTLLKEKFEFRPNEIEWLADFDEEADGGASEDEIRAAIGRLCEDAEENDIRVFIFIGHGDQTPNNDGTERDNQDEYIIVANGGHILDDELKRILVKPLLHCKLTAIFDCCHSGTMLDLRFSSEDSTPSTLETVSNPPSRSNTDSSQSEKQSTGAQSHEVNIEPGLGSNPMIRPNVSRLGDKVYSISACSDPQRAWEFKNGYSLTDLIVRTIRDDPEFVDSKEIPLLKLFHKISAKFDKIAKLIQARSTQPGPNPDIDIHETYTKQDPQLGTQTRPSTLLDNENFIL